MPELPDLPHGNKLEPILPAHNNAVDAINKLARDYAAGFEHRSREGDEDGQFLGGLGPIVCEQFLGIIRESSPGEVAARGGVDARYDVERYAVKNTLANGGLLDGRADSFPDPEPSVVATNLAERASGGHTVKVGTVVNVFAVYVPGDPGGPNDTVPLRREHKHYFFYHAAIGSAVLVTVEGEEDGEGHYNGYMFAIRDPALAEVNVDEDLALSDMGGDPVYCFVHNAPEYDQNSHWLPYTPDIRYIGIITSYQADGTPCVTIHAQRPCFMGTPVDLQTSVSCDATSAPHTTTWDVEVDGDVNLNGCIFQVVTKVQRCELAGSDPTGIYQFARVFRMNSCGKITKIEAETKTLILEEGCD